MRARTCNPCSSAFLANRSSIAVFAALESDGLPPCGKVKSSPLFRLAITEWSVGEEISVRQRMILYLETVNKTELHMTCIPFDGLIDSCSWNINVSDSAKFDHFFRFSSLLVYLLYSSEININIWSVIQ